MWSANPCLLVPKWGTNADRVPKGQEYRPRLPKAAAWERAAPFALGGGGALRQLHGHAVRRILLLLPEDVNDRAPALDEAVRRRRQVMLDRLHPRARAVSQQRDSIVSPQED